MKAWFEASRPGTLGALDRVETADVAADAGEEVLDRRQCKSNVFQQWMAVSTDGVLPRSSRATIRRLVIV